MLKGVFRKMQLSTGENELLIKICQKNNTDANQLIVLLEIEKDFANRNLMRRKGIKVKMQEHINEWVKQG